MMTLSLTVTPYPGKKKKKKKSVPEIGNATVPQFLQMDEIPPSFPPLGRKENCWP